MRPINKQKEADRAKWLLSLPGGDHLTLLNAYNKYHKSNFFHFPLFDRVMSYVLVSPLTDISDTKWTWSNYLSKRNLVQADNVRSQLQRIMERNNIPLLSNFSHPKSEEKLHENIRRALLTGLFTQVAHWDPEKKAYLTVKDVQPVQLHPSCDLDGKPDWVVFNEFVLTTTPYIRTVSAVDPEWWVFGYLSFSFPLLFIHRSRLCRLLKEAPKFYDISSWPESSMRVDLERASKRLSRKTKKGAAS